MRATPLLRSKSGVGGCNLLSRVVQSFSTFDLNQVFCFEEIVLLETRKHKALSKNLRRLPR